MAVGINVSRHLLIVWCIAGAICVLGGTLWTFVTGGGFGLGLVGLKIFPIVIIGGLDSIPGTIVAAILIGVVESLATGYLDPHLGGGCGLLASYVALRRNVIRTAPLGSSAENKWSEYRPHRNSRGEGRTR